MDNPVAEELGPSCIEPMSSALITIDESAMERPGSSCCEPDSLAIVPLDEPASKRTTPPCDLQAGFGERLHNRLYETIEMSCSLVQGDLPEGNQMDSEREVVSQLVPLSDVHRSEDVSPVEREANPASEEKSGNSDPTEGDSTNDNVHISACPPSCAEMKQTFEFIICVFCCSW